MGDPDTEQEFPPLSYQVTCVQGATLLLKACDVGDLKTVKAENKQRRRCGTGI